MYIIQLQISTLDLRGDCKTGALGPSCCCQDDCHSYSIKYNIAVIIACHNSLLLQKYILIPCNPVLDQCLVLTGMIYLLQMQIKRYSRTNIYIVSSITWKRGLFFIDTLNGVYETLTIP